MVLKNYVKLLFVDRTVHVAFRREVHHMRRLELSEHTIQFGPIADVDLLELEPVGFRDGREVFEIASVRKIVNYAHGILRVVDDVPSHCRTDDPASPVIMMRFINSCKSNVMRIELKLKPRLHPHFDRQILY